MALTRGTAQGTVFYLALEEKRSEVRAHFRAMGATGDEPIHVLFGPTPTDAISQLEAAAQRERPSLIIVDPVQKLVKAKDLNDYAEMDKALDPLLRIARDTGAHLLFVHHARKGRLPADGDGALGSTAIVGAVDSCLFLRGSKHCRSLWTMQRYGEDLEERVLELDPTTRVPRLGETKEQFDREAMEEAILTALRRSPEPLIEDEIHERVSGRTGQKRAALRRLVSRRQVARSGRGARGDPYRYSFPEAGT